MQGGLVVTSFLGFQGGQFGQQGLQVHLLLLVLLFLLVDVPLEVYRVFYELLVHVLLVEQLARRLLDLLGVVFGGTTGQLGSQPGQFFFEHGHLLRF